MPEEKVARLIESAPKSLSSLHDRIRRTCGSGAGHPRARIIYEKSGAIARVTLNWPEKANAQDQKLAEEVDAALLDADRDYDVKVVILKANGKGFCSGHAIGNNARDYPSFAEGARPDGHTVEGPDGPLRQADARTSGSYRSRLLPRCMVTALVGAPTTD